MDSLWEEVLFSIQTGLIILKGTGEQPNRANRQGWVLMATWCCSVWQDHKMSSGLQKKSIWMLTFCFIGGLCTHTLRLDTFTSFNVADVDKQRRKYANSLLFFLKGVSRVPSYINSYGDEVCVRAHVSIIEQLRPSRETSCLQTIFVTATTEQSWKTKRKVKQILLKVKKD